MKLGFFFHLNVHFHIVLDCLMKVNNKPRAQKKFSCYHPQHRDLSLATNTETENVLHGNPPFLNNPSFPIIFLLFSIIRQNLTLPEDIPWSERSDSFHSLNQINRTYCNVTYLTLILALSSL